MGTSVTDYNVWIGPKIYCINSYAIQKKAVNSFEKSRPAIIYTLQKKIFKSLFFSRWVNFTQNNNFTEPAYVYKLTGKHHIAEKEVIWSFSFHISSSALPNSLNCISFEFLLLGRVRHTPLSTVIHNALFISSFVLYYFPVHSETPFHWLMLLCAVRLIKHLNPYFKLRHGFLKRAISHFFGKAICLWMTMVLISNFARKNSHYTLTHLRVLNKE